MCTILTILVDFYQGKKSEYNCAFTNIEKLISVSFPFHHFLLLYHPSESLYSGKQVCFAVQAIEQKTNFPVRLIICMQTSEK